MKRTLSPESLHDIATQLGQAHKAFQSRYPGATGARQPAVVVISLLLRFVQRGEPTLRVTRQRTIFMNCDLYRSGQILTTKG